MFKKIGLLLVLSCITLNAQAMELKISNETNLYGTAKFKGSDCSSALGEGGIAKPQSSITVPQILLDLYCAINCEAYIYVSKNCDEATRIATVKLNHNSGITGIKNESSNHYVSGNGFNAVVR